MKNLAISLLPLTISLFLSGCVNPKTANSLKEKEITTLRIAWWGEQPRHDYTIEVIQLFEEKNPDIHIEYEYTNWDDYWKRLAPMGAASQLPDVMQMDLMYLIPYSDNGLLADLHPYIENNVIETATIDQNIISGGMVGKHVYGFPLGVNAPAVIIDSELLSGVVGKLPDPDWTWDEFEEFAMAATEKGKIYGTNGMKPPDVFFPYYLRTNGGSLYNAEGNSLGYSDDQLFIDYFARQLRLLKEGALPRVDITEQIKGIENELLVKKQSAMTWAYSNQFYGFLQAASRPLDLMPLPGPGQGEGLQVKASMLFSIATNSNHKEEAARFINFFVNDKEANTIIKGERGVPVSETVAEEVRKGLSEDETKVFDYVLQIQKGQDKVEQAHPRGGIEVVNILNDISEQIFFKKITLKEGAETFRREAEKVLLDAETGS